MADLRILADTFRTFTHVMEKEAKYNPSCRPHSHKPYAFYQTAQYLLEVAHSCIMPRGWCEAFGVTSPLGDFTTESVGAHTYLIQTMVALMLRSEVGHKFLHHGCTNDDFDYLEIMEAIRLHDLPENAIGDWLDNGSRDESDKFALEDNWYSEFKQNYTTRERRLGKFAYDILMGMREKQGPTGKMLYAADKTALIITALAYDRAGHPLTMHIGNPNASERDKQEMCICEWHEAGNRKASEMFTTDVFHIREITQYDETGFFTALVVMCTIIVNGKWYDWRKMDYEYP